MACVSSSSSVSKLLFQLKSVVSSAYKTDGQGKLKAMSFIDMMNKNGPRTDPWGTPAFTPLKLDFSWPWTTRAKKIIQLSNSSIDCVCSNITPQEINVSTFTTGISDHKAQLSSIYKCSTPLPIVNSERRHLNKKNLDHLKEILRDQEWDEIINTENVNTAYKKLSGILTSAMNTACPYKKSRSKQRHNFRSMSDPVASRLQKDFLEALEQEKLRPGVVAKRLTAERKKAYDLRLKFCRRQATANFINNADNKPKAIWDTINSERQKKCTESAIELEVTERKLRIHSK
ncbi:hypothetical protein J6590_053716 [Homalodisca vitripennis]|nr:hypothetical protein J6590_053716 [Homalodisca vitripennis]